MRDSSACSSCETLSRRPVSSSIASVTKRKLPQPLATGGVDQSEEPRGQGGGREDEQDDEWHVEPLAVGGKRWVLIPPRRGLKLTAEQRRETRDAGRVEHLEAVQLERMVRLLERARVRRHGEHVARFPSEPDDARVLASRRVGEP